MASGKYMAVFKSEKSMTDAILSALANLHKAARKKSNHLWSPYMYDALRTILGDDDTDPKTNKIDCDENKNVGSAKANLTVKGDGLNIQANAVKMRENHHVGDTEKPSSRVDCKVSEEKNGENVLRKFQNVDNSPNGCGLETWRESYSDLKAPCDQKSLKSQSEWISDKENEVEFRNNIFRRPVRYGAPDKLSFSRQNTTTETNITRSKEFNNSVLSQIKNESVCPLIQSPFTTAEMSYQNEDISAQVHLTTSSNNNDDEITSKPSSISKTRRLQKLHVEQNTLRSKRNRDDSDSSTGSTKPLQKKILVENGDANRNSKDKGGNFSIMDLLSVRIVKDDQFHEITISASEFDRVRKKYPRLMEVLPDIDTFEKEVPYCAEAVKVVIGYLFHPPYDFNTMPDGRIPVEILAATKAWAIQRFHDNFQQHFVRKITGSNCRTVYSLARHFDLHQICSACKIFLPEPSEERRSFKSRKCFITVSHYVEPQELCIPLSTAEQLLNDNFDRDIRNTVVFEAITKDFNVTGFQISLDAPDGTVDKTSAVLDIFYSIKLTNSPTDETEEIKLSRPLRPNIVVYFKQKAVLRKGEKMQISVETTIKPYLCFETYENVIKKSDNAQFSLTVESTYRVKNSGGKRFIIGKLLYNPVDEV